MEISPDSDEDILDKIEIKKHSDEKDYNEEEDSDKKKNKYNQKLPDYRRNYYLTYEK